MSNTPDDFLMGGGGASARFDNVGDTITGTVTTTEVRQQTSLQDGKPLTWDDGSPRMQLVVTLQTDLRDEADDDGKRNLYVKGSKQPGSKSLHDAVRTAVQGAGAKGLEEGGTLTVTFVGEEPSATRGFNPRKLYEASYVKPDHAAQSGGFLGTVGGQPAAPATPPVSAPAQQPASAPAPAPAQQAPAPAQQPPAGGADAGEKARQLISIGYGTDTEIAAAVGLDAAVVAAIRAKYAA